MEVIARINIDSPTGRKLVHEIEKHKKIADLFNIRQLFQILNPCLCYLGYFRTTQKKAFSLRLFADHNSNLGVSGRSCDRRKGEGGGAGEIERKKKKIFNPMLQS